ncbi:MAG: CDP-glycerol glycerophosphotransferase family protein, partial [Eubacteriales bacterium]|nr:CDP-glycerol glycerophosphotransferase family protein [Eubacteriales bacterium]
MILKILFTVLGFFARLFCKPYRDLWLIMERGNDARDNGYWFFRYLREEHPEINCAYVITDDSIDRERVSSIGRTITYKSPEHYLAYYSAKYLLSTHVQPCAPDLILHYHLAKYGIRPGGKEVFLQHGIIKDEMQWLWRKNLHVDMFVCGAKPEYDYIKKVYGHPEGVVRYTGLCRFDNLIKAGEPDKMILVMPTWRGSGYPSGSDFVNTAYYKSFQGLLNSRVLDGKL